MKLIGRVLPSLLLAATTSAFASDNNPTDEPMSRLATYLLNLGQYLGYNIQISPTDPNNSSSVASVSQTMLSLAKMQSVENYLINTFLGAFPINTAGQNQLLFVPSTAPGGYANINAYANYTFTNPTAYNSTSPEQISVSSLIDQPTYQADPVSQAVLNTLGTPDYSYCLTNDGTAVATCSYPTTVFNQDQVMANVIGNIPDTQTYFSYSYNQPVLAQLNVNTLMGPLMYSSTNSNSSSTSSGSGNATNQNQGLVATNPAQQAANFIRYATGAVAPVSLPNRNEYDTLYTKALNQGNAYTALDQQQAQASLTAYLANLRIFAAQTSVGVSNLYYILAKRMPQNQTATSSGQQTSQALSEFTMATWRLYNPDQSTNTQWLTQINQASAATVQKEIAGLLAEINYQLYLTRVQQERLLLTNSILLLQNARSAQPSASLSTAAPSSSASGEQ